MELVTAQIDKIEDLLSKMDEIIDNSRSVPFSSKVSVEKDALFGIIDDIRAVAYDMRKGLPSEFNQAKRVLHDKDNHISEARAKAEMILKAAEIEADKMRNEHEVTVQARMLAAEIADRAGKETNEFKLSAAQYVDGIFHDLDELLRRTFEDQMRKSREVEEFYRSILEELYHNRKEIRIDSGSK